MSTPSPGYAVTLRVEAPAVAATTSQPARTVGDAAGALTDAREITDGMA
ncbi:hypothetical protein ABZ553_25055 [Streptomyces sparsogenes]